MEKYSFEDEISSSSILHRLLGGENDECERRGLRRAKWHIVVIFLDCTLLLVNTVFLAAFYAQRQNHDVPKLPSHGKFSSYPFVLRPC